MKRLLVIFSLLPVLAGCVSPRETGAQVAPSSMAVAARAGELERFVDVRIVPSEGADGYRFEAVLRRAWRGGGSAEGMAVLGGSDQLRVPAFPVRAGEEARFAMNGADGEPVIAAVVLVDEESGMAEYDVYFRVEDGSYRAAGSVQLRGGW